MVNIYIPFFDYWNEKLLGDIKVCTSRVKQYGKVGDTFNWAGGVFEIVKIEKVKLSVVRDKYWKKEGCDSPEHFVKIWGNIHHKKGFVPDQIVWLHHFKKVS